VLVCAAWPAARLAHWRLFTSVRAVEQRIWLVACNAVDSLRGVRTWCSDHDRIAITVTLPANPTEDDILRALAQLASRVDVLLFAMQGIASRSLPLLHRLGIDVARSGDELKIASLAGDPATELGNSNMLAVDLRPREFGQQAVQLLMDATGDTEHRPLHRVHRPSLQ
jgi:DNA-binding LacI/PurR family transcriptional regulator